MCRLIQLLSFATLLGVLSCGGTAVDATASRATPGTVRVGFLYNLGSGLQNYDREMSARLAAEEINARGGVLGRPIEILANGDRIGSPSGMAGTQSLLDAGVVAIVGGSTSSLTVETAKLTAPAGVPICAPSSTSPTLSLLTIGGRRVSGDLTWRTALSDTFQGRVLARQVLAQGVQTTAVIFRQDTYGQGLADTFRASYEAGGGRITAFLGYPGTQSSGFGPQVAALLAPEIPQGVVIIAFTTDGAALSRDFRAASPSPMPRFFAGDAVFNSDFLSNGDTTILEGLQGTAPSAPFGSVEYQDYLLRFRARMGYDPIGNPPAAAYDAVYLFALAMEREGAVGAQAVRNSLRAVSGGLGEGGAKVGPMAYEAAVQTLRRGLPIDYQGASGAIDFDANGDVTSGSYAWWVIRNRTFVTQAIVN